LYLIFILNKNIQFTQYFEYIFNFLDYNTFNFLRRLIIVHLDYIYINKYNKLLIDNYYKRNKFIEPRLYNWKKNLKIGQEIDCLDSNSSNPNYTQTWFESIIIEKKNNKLFIHFYGWSKRFNEWIDINNFRILPKNTKTKKWRNKIKINSNIEVKINCPKIYNTKTFWHRSKIIFIRDNRYIAIRFIKCNLCKSLNKSQSKKNNKEHHLINDDTPYIYDINNKEIVSNIDTHRYLRRDYI